jgi:MFS transporter, DHA2 family, multidrug resistance protein
MSVQSVPAVGVAAPVSQDGRVSVRTWIAVMSGMLGAFMAFLDIGITNSSLLNILGTLSATQDEGSWIATAYLVAEIIAIPLTGLFARALGLRVYLVGNAAMFLLFSTLCGSAWNLTSMIVFRVLQGFASGALIPTAMMLVVSKLPAAKRATGLGLFGLTAMLAPTLGPTVGGYLSDTLGWPSIFYINWAPGLLLIAGILYGLDREAMRLEKLVDADWLGVGLMAIGLGSLTVMLEEGNQKDWFGSPFIVGAAGLAIFGLLGWIANSTWCDAPFVNLSLFGRRNFLVAAVLAAVTGVGLYGCSFLLPLYLAQVARYTPTQIGVVIMWAGLPQLLVMPVAARLVAKIDNRILCSAGLALFGTSCLMNVNLDATTGHDQLMLSQIVRALGQPFIMLTIGNFALDRVAPSDTASASSLYNMIRNLGGSIGIALLATTLTNREHFHSARIGESISLYAPATQLRLDQLTQSFLSSGVEATAAANQALQVIDNIVRREAYVMAYNDSFWIVGMIFFSCIGVLWLADSVKAPSRDRPSGR